jgi:5'-nucleotidase
MNSVIRPLALACTLAVAGPALAASSVTCTGNVTIGEGVTQISTSIANKAVGGQCLNDLIIDTVREGANYDNHGEFVVDVARLLGHWLRSHAVTFKESAELIAAAAKSGVGKTVTVRVIGFNDFHGNLQSPGTFGVNLSIPPAQRPAVGGAEYIAGHVEKLKSANPLNVVVGAGDFIGASPLISALFHDEPAIEVMNRVGLEFNAVGNHEFDHGASELLRLQNGGCKPGDPNSCKGASVGTPVPFEGAKFKWLSANVINTATRQPLLPAYGIKQFGKIRVAFIGMTLKETPTIVTPAGVAGLDFRDEAATVNALIPELKRHGAQAIVVLVHQGGFQTGSSQDINGCDGSLAASPIQSIVNRLDNAVDAVISGHTHAAYNCQLPNLNGRLISVTSASAFGRVLTSLDLVIDTKTRDVKQATATNSLVDRTDPAVTPNAQVKTVVTGYNALVSPIANQVIGSITTDLPNSAIDGACNMPAGDVIADAQLQATVPAAFGSAVIAFMNRGGVRNPGFTFASSPAGEGNGNVTYGEAFTAQPFGNSLVTMTLTALDIKNVLEEQFAGCRGQSPTATRIMLPSAGFSYTWDGSKACDQRISNVKLASNGSAEILVDGGGVVQNPLKTYRVTVNNFMATGGDGYSTFLNGKDLLGGAQDIDALVAYLANFKAPNPPYDPANPALGKPRISRIGASTVCPGGTNTNP